MPVVERRQHPAVGQLSCHGAQAGQVNRLTAFHQQANQIEDVGLTVGQRLQFDVDVMKYSHGSGRDDAGCAIDE